MDSPPKEQKEQSNPLRDPRLFLLQSKSTTTEKKDSLSLRDPALGQTTPTQPVDLQLLLHPNQDLEYLNGSSPFNDQIQPSSNHSRYPYVDQLPPTLDTTSYNAPELEPSTHQNHLIQPDYAPSLTQEFHNPSPISSTHPPTIILPINPADQRPSEPYGSIQENHDHHPNTIQASIPLLPSDHQPDHLSTLDAPSTLAPASAPSSQILGDVFQLQDQSLLPNPHPDPDPNPNHPPSHSPTPVDHGIARSREMSLSIDSNPDQVINPAREISQVVTPGFLTDDPSDSTPNPPITHQLPNPPRLSHSPPNNNKDIENDDNDSSKTASELKFPLPTKPPNQPLAQNQPLFAPSPTMSESAKPIESSSSTFRPPPVLSRLASLKQRVEKDPMDGEAWIELISDAEKKGDLEKTREVYSSFLQNFPDAANQWIAYADLELGHGHFPEVEQIFSRCLRSSVSVELWAFYLNYIRRVNPVEGDKAAASRAIIVSAYDFSLNHIGIDRESGQIWLDYINIVKAGEASGTWQEQQKMDSLRKLYQRAVCIPLGNIEQLWKDYDHFEHQISKMTAKKFLADKSAQYMMARATLKEMKALSNSLLRPKVPVKPNWKRIDDHKQLAQWKAYLAWEEKNPLEISDKNLLNTRIQYAYRQAIMHMRFHPEIWYLFASHLQKNDKNEEALTVIQAGLIANPTSIVLTYAMVEVQENLKNYAACYDAFSSLVQHYHNEIDEINKTIEKEISHGISFIEPKPTPSGAGLADGEADQELTEEDAQRAKEEDRLRTNITALYKPKIDELREAAASVWITEMRFARRTEGIKPARAAFTRARKAPYITRHVFEASAMMEYHWNKDAAVATKVFDLGLKIFSDDVNYVLQYLDFLITLNDDSNARALFEKTISKIPPNLADPLWRRWATYEFIYGDKAASEKLNSRIAEIFPEWGVVERLSDRHTYAGLKDVLGRELGTAIEPIPLRRSPTPVAAPAEGFGAKRMGGANEGIHHLGGIPSGPASYRNRQRDRSFSPDFRTKRARVPPPRGSVSPDCRHGPTSELSAAPPPNTNHNNKRGRDNFDSNSKRNRFSSPPRNKVQTPPPAVAVHQPPVNPFAWFPDGLRYFLSILPAVASFEGPRLDSSTVIQVLSEANIPIVNNPTSTTPNSNLHSGGGTHQGGGNASSNNTNRAGPVGRGDGFNSNSNSTPVPVGWGPNRGSLHGSSNSNSSANHPSRGNHGSGRRGRRK